ncbi:CPBP family intramembrane glutamic endopeptidase [Brevibacillus sp. H7]|uniref:CPBP family intramembrane glutamic endopeptidase n=1 Tax=Brevibacillus sp. H7 TaxID=3349138 RepID=UPI003800E972
MSNPLDELDIRTLRLNLCITQGIVWALAASASFLIHGREKTYLMFTISDRLDFAYAGGVAMLAVGASIAMARYLPRTWQDDGNINERIFIGLPFWQTLGLCITVGVGEEWLFRGVLQPLIGNVWTSLVFMLVHVRYLRKPLLLVSVFGTSYLLGCLFELHDSLLPPIFAHIVIDLSLAVYLQKTHREGRN